MLAANFHFFTAWAHGHALLAKEVMTFIASIFGGAFLTNKGAAHPALTLLVTIAIAAL